MQRTEYPSCILCQKPVKSSFVVTHYDPEGQETEHENTFLDGADGVVLYRHDGCTKSTRVKDPDDKIIRVKKRYIGDSKGNAYSLSDMTVVMEGQRFKKILPWK